MLPILLLVLFSTSSVGLALTLAHGRSTTQPESRFFSASDRRVLVDARQAIVTYATLYPFLYGPRGAGPGHLPCPATQGRTQLASSAYSPGRHYSSDSPDPPCGRQSPASGFLPRHVRLAEQRYAFHIEPAQLASYRVSGRFINNPVNRTVNPTLLLPQHGHTFAASIELPGQSQGRYKPQVVVSKKALFNGVFPAVAGWIIERSRSLTHHWCGSVSDTAASERIVAWQCSIFVQLAEQCPQNVVVLLTVDHLPRDGSCSMVDLHGLLVEGVPARSHWFFRNQWIPWVAVENAELCSAYSADKDKPCALRYVRPPSVLNNSVKTALPSADVARIALAWEKAL